jgi:NAD(P)-dependent dehydrogenase (short-subunit alcohol dehydrogenase family)
MDARVAIVTGGSRGIGAAIAVRAAKAGHSVLVNYSPDAAGAASVVEEIRDCRGEALAHQADVSDPAAVGPMFDRAATLGPVTAVVNNAGITGNLIGNPVDVPPDTVRRVMDVNVSGLIYVCQEAVRKLSTRMGGPGGSIVMWLLSGEAGYVTGAVLPVAAEGAFCPIGAGGGFGFPSAATTGV